jgi:glyoxylate/hydroxypyruvate reductase
MCGPAISSPGLTIGFLGFGRISQETLRRLLAFTSKSEPPCVLYLSSRARPNQAELDADFSKDFGVSISRAEKDEIAAASDILVVLCNQTPDTVNMVDRAFLKRMKKTAVLINGARGPIVNSDDLADALDAGEIFGAGLDVITGEPNVGPDHRLVQAKNCVVIPHMGSGDYDTRKKMANLCEHVALQS